MDLLKQLSEISGAPGREEHVRELIIRNVAGVCDSYRVDAMGNLICEKKSGQPNAERVMVACHMDEIAFYVRMIDENGFLRVQQLGGFDTRNLFARRVRVETRDGQEFIGNMNPSGKPIHVASPEDRKKIPTIGELAVDVGMDAARAKELFRPGDPVTLMQDFVEMGDLATGKSMDNRVACWCGVRLLERMKSPKYDVFVVFTVQEEIGIRGAITSSYDVQPDIGIAIDVTLAVDTPGVPDDDQITSLGGGAAIKIMDSSLVSDKDLVDEFIEIAEKHEIPHQFEILPLGGTDAGGMQRTRGGCRAITLSVPCRYVHTVTETIHRKDLNATVDLLHRFVEP